MKIKTDELKKELKTLDLENNTPNENKRLAIGLIVALVTTIPIIVITWSYIQAGLYCKITEEQTYVNFNGIQKVNYTLPKLYSMEEVKKWHENKKNTTTTYDGKAKAECNVYPQELFRRLNISDTPWKMTQYKN